MSHGLVCELMSLSSLCIQADESPTMPSFVSLPPPNISLFVFAGDISHLFHSVRAAYNDYLPSTLFYLWLRKKKNILLLMLFYLIIRFSFAFQLCFLCCEGVKIDKYSSYCGSLSFLLSHNGLFIFCFTGP